MENSNPSADLINFGRSPELAALPDQIIEDAINLLEEHPEIKYQLANDPNTLIKECLAKASPHFQELFQVYLLRNAVNQRISKIICNIDNVATRHANYNLSGFDKAAYIKKYQSQIAASNNLELQFIGHLISEQTLQKMEKIEFLKSYTKHKSFEPDFFIPTFAGLIASHIVSKYCPDINQITVFTSTLATIIAINFYRKTTRDKIIGSILQEKVQDIPPQIEASAELLKHIFKLKKLQQLYGKSLDSKKVKQADLIGAIALQYAQKLDSYTAEYQQVFETYACENELAVQQQNNPIQLENVDHHLDLLALSTSANPSKVPKSRVAPRHSLPAVQNSHSDELQDQQATVEAAELKKGKA